MSEAYTIVFNVGGRSRNKHTAAHEGQDKNKGWGADKQGTVWG